MLFSRFARGPPGTPRGGPGGGCTLGPPRAAAVGRSLVSFPHREISTWPQGGSRLPLQAQLEQIWEDIREELREETPDFKYHIWLEPLELAAVRGRTLYVRAPDHIRTSVSERYLPLLLRAAARRFDEQASVEVVDAAWQPSAESELLGTPATSLGSDLNPKYTFDQFVMGEENRFAHAAALAVAELPAHSYNPLFLYGPPGIGKTHLLHAVGNYVERYAASLSVRYATIDEFTTEFVEALRRRRTDRFRESFREADVLLVDDVQFLAGRTKTREEFFHTFNSLLGSGRQLVMTSDRSPEDIPGLEERLIERFRAGLVVELEPPDAFMRAAILAKRADLDGIEIDDATLAEISARVTTSVRALEGALTRVVAYASLKSESATPGLARHVLRRLGTDTGTETCSISEIVDAASSEFGVDRDELLAHDRRPGVVTARHVAMYLARELTSHSLPEIGRGMGGRSHTTVLNGVNRISAALQTDPSVQTAVDNLRRRLGRPR
jgi:chromosomal replication initiator protein